MKQKFSIRFDAATHVGMVRADNQDTFGIFPPDEKSVSPSKGSLFVVADGMGGHKGGKVASEMAVKTIGDVYFLDESESVWASLVNAIQAANEAVFSASKRDRALSGMGTTCVALVAKGSTVYVAHIGDSRAYRVTRERILQLTEDHATVAEMQRRGLLTAEEAKHHPERSVLYRALGTKLEAKTDVQPELIVGGEEWFVLCTDGLSNMVTNSEIHEIVVAHPPKKACDQLVALANERGGFDNITVVVVQVTAS
jgi:serine/threonine protein phosphatase PrpC